MGIFGNNKNKDMDKEQDKDKNKEQENQDQQDQERKEKQEQGEDQKKYPWISSSDDGGGKNDEGVKKDHGEKQDSDSDDGSKSKEGKKIDKEDHKMGTPSDIDGTEVDVILEVPELKVDRININVENLEAKVDVDVDVLELVNIDAGVYAHLDQVKVEIEGVRAEAYLQVRLGRVNSIVWRVNEMIDNNADMLAEVLEPISRGAQGAVEGVGEGVKEAGGGSE